MAVRWTPAAANDLEQIARYLKEHHPDFAEDTVGTLYHAAESLHTFPVAAALGVTRERANSSWGGYRT